MHDLYDNLEELCETVAEEIREANGKIKKAGGKISPGDVEYLDKLTHMLKSIKTTKAMMESEHSYDDMGTYARGRNARRDSMGRYSGERHYMPYNRSYDGNSYGGDMVSELRELMNEAPNTQIRNKFQQFIEEVERMR